jgi:hypothetical protein
MRLEGTGEEEEEEKVILMLYYVRPTPEKVEINGVFMIKLQKFDTFAIPVRTIFK